MPEASALPIVVDPADMSDENFMRHMNNRHMPMGGMQSVPDDGGWPAGIKTMRAYHDHEHHWAETGQYSYQPSNHEHEEA